MRKRNFLTIGLSLVLMLVMCVATALLSFSLADEVTPDTTRAGSGAAASSSSTNIDIIIDNSHGTDVDDSGRELSQFYIVEIGSSNTGAHSELYAMLNGSRQETKVNESGETETITVNYNDLVGGTETDAVSQFVKNVIDGWSTKNDHMTRRKINYTYYSAAGLRGSETLETEAKQAIAKADLIYISNDPDNQYTKTNDIKGSIKESINQAITTNQTPFIIDSPTKTQEGDGGGTSAKTYAGFAQNVLATAGANRKAFGYDTQYFDTSKTDVENVREYFNRESTASLWLPISGDSRAAGWAINSDNTTTARFLTITKDNTWEGFAYDGMDPSDNAVFTSGTKSVVVACDESGNVVLDADGRINILENHTDGMVFGYFDNPAAPSLATLHIISLPDSSFAVTNKVITAASDTYEVFTRDRNNAVFQSGTYTVKIECDDLGNIIRSEDGAVNILEAPEGMQISYTYDTNPDSEEHEPIYDDAHFHVISVDDPTLVFERISRTLEVSRAVFEHGDSKVVLECDTDGKIKIGTDGSVSVLERPASGLISITYDKDEDGNPIYDESHIHVEVYSPEVTVDPINHTLSFHINTGKGNTLYDYGYSNTQYRPDHVIFQFAVPNDAGEIVDGNGTVNLAPFDMLILENSLKDCITESGVYDTLYSKVYSLDQFLYDSRLAAGGSSSSSTFVKSDAQTYQDIMDIAATEKEVPRYDWVLVTGKGEMRVYRNATSKSGVKAIADIINKGSYRGMGSGEDTARIYTVLEIQPCYPIDLNLAAVLTRSDLMNISKDSQHHDRNDGYDDTNIFYYLDARNMLNKTSDEIGFDSGNGVMVSLADMESTDNSTTGISSRGAVQNSSWITAAAPVIDYYAWELSKAKVAKLTGMRYEQVNVVHMSTTEFNTSRLTLLDNYDAIYIGGNNSAIRKIDKLKNSFVAGRSAATAAIYNMYYHNGGTYQKGDEIGVFTGNDLTFDRMIDLENYILAGMPVIVTKPLADAYFGAVKDGDNQTLLDPESNMFELIKFFMNDDVSAVAAKDAASRTRNDYLDSVKDNKKANVCFGFNPADQVKAVNDDGAYGTTYGGFVTVFGGLETQVYVKSGTRNTLTTITPNRDSVNAYDASEMLKHAQTRPKFALSIFPTVYKEGDVSTEITGNNITFKYEVTLSTFLDEDEKKAAANTPAYTINVYADDNTDTQFGENEILYTRTFNYDESGEVAKTGKFTATFSSQFDGALYWKFEVVTHHRNGSTSFDLKSSTARLSKVKIKEKNYVNLLQIMPEKAATASKVNGSTLFFCTECQQAKAILKANRYTGDGKKYGTPYTVNNNFTDAANIDGNIFTVALQNPVNGDPAYNPNNSKTTYVNQAQNKNLGTHVHNFGIVKYDANLQYTGNGTVRGQDAAEASSGNDDWSKNWAYDLLKDFDFDMDIWTTRQFETNVDDVIKVVNATYTEKGANGEDVVIPKKTIIDNYYKLATTYKNYYLAMKAVVDGSIDTSSKYYQYLKNKLTAPTSTSSMYTETNATTLKENYNQTLAEYNLETAKGGFGVSVQELNQYLVAQKNLDTLLDLARAKIDHMGDTGRADMLDEIDYEQTYHRYYDFYNLSNAANDAGKYPGWSALSYEAYAADGTNTTKTTVTANANFYLEFTKYYQYWRNAKIYEQYFYKMYMKYLGYGTAYGVQEKDSQGNNVTMYYPDYYKIYTCIVIGVDRGFGSDDIKTDAAIQALQKFIEQDGNMFIFRNTLSDKYDKSNDENPNTAKMTEGLKTLFGQDYNHMVVKTKEITQTVFPYYFSSNDQDGNCQYGKITGYDNVSGSFDVTSEGLSVDVVMQYGNILSLTVSKNSNAGKLSLNWVNWNYNKTAYTADNGTKSFNLCLDGDHKVVCKASTSGTNGSAEFKINLEPKTYMGTVNELRSNNNVTYKMADGSSRTVTESDIYRYTSLLKGGQTIGVSGTHKTQFNEGAFGNTTWNSLNMYTQTSILANVVQVQNRDLNFKSGTTNTVTDRASQTNEGVITMYPFNVGKELKVSETVPNGFSTDIESKDMVVYYALAGGQNTQYMHSSAMAADPHDGIDNYYLYSYGSVTYCGAGNSNLTGPKRDNNDERKLFINVIVNTAKKSVFGPAISVYDAPVIDGSTVQEDTFGRNSVVGMNEKGEYLITITNTNEIPEFSYRVTVPDATDEVDEVMIYYDLSAGQAGAGDFEFADGTDVEIFHAFAENDGSILKDMYKPIMMRQGVVWNGKELYIPNLQLNLNDLDYFRPYDYKYTYIVIGIRTKKGDYAYQRIMVKLAPKLWELT